LEFVAANCEFYFALCIQALSQKVDFGSHMHVRSVGIIGFSRFCS